jgi:hypothetical protein
MMHPQKYVRPEQWAQLTARAWLDPQFKELLETDPVKAIKEVAGIECEFVLQVPPRPRTVSEHFLDDISRGETEALVIAFSCICFD